MKILSVSEAVRQIQNYMRRMTFQPYFVVADGVAEYDALKKFFCEGFQQIRISDMCRGDSVFDIDLFNEKLNVMVGNVLVLGMGEYVYFTGQENILREVQDRNFSCKVLFLCRGVSGLIRSMADEDRKFEESRVCRVEGSCKFSVVKYGSAVDIETDAGNFSELLRLTEDGKTSVSVRSELPLLNVAEIETPYEELKNREPHFEATSDALSEKQWREYFADDNCAGYPPEHWRSFAAGFKGKITDLYLKYVFERSADFEAYRKNLFFALFDVNADRFEDFYLRRKEVVKNFSSSYLAAYLEHLKNFPMDEALRYLTDNTAAECHAMIRLVQGRQEIPLIVKKNYSALNDYLTDYDFGDATITGYFRRYKEIKLCNVEDSAFKELVCEMAARRLYNRFETRQSILEALEGSAKLYWLDALGVEFLSLIHGRATRQGLGVRSRVARAELPTLTSLNKNFYEEWRGDKFGKNQRLDDLKHAQETFVGGRCSAPLYMVEEFSIVDGVIDAIKNDLTAHGTEKIILTSDHGASRLAVMYGREAKRKMNSVGEHGGRCCPTNDVDLRPANAVEENGYWISTDYDRFAGGRLGSVEVHGGATLEEILVPVVEFSLSNSSR